MSPVNARRSAVVKRSVWLGLVAILGLGTGCGSDAECVIDSDCPSLAQRCEANRCVPLGGPVDLGMPDMGDGGVRDGAVRDGSTDGATGDAGPVDAGPAATRVGIVLAQSSSAGGFVIAAFDETPAGAAPRCTTREEGPCLVSVCETGTGSAEARTAGTVTVTSGEQMVVLEPGMDGRYPASSLSMSLFGPGAPLSVSATGDADGGVPAFTGMVTSASPATLTMPSVSDGVTLSVPTGSDFALAWSAGGPTGQVEVNLNGMTSDGKSATARCRFGVTTFGGTIPAAALSDFPAGSSGGYQIFVVNESPLTPGNGWEVGFGTRTPIGTSSGALAAGAATF
jgi:hypothetical protein